MQRGVSFQEGLVLDTSSCHVSTCDVRRFKVCSACRVNECTREFLCASSWTVSVLGHPFLPPGKENPLVLPENDRHVVLQLAGEESA